VLTFIPTTFATTESVTVKPLVILIEFQDYNHTQIYKKEKDPHVTGDTFPNYEKALYEELFFGEGTYVGPDGNNYITMREYFETVSRGYYITDGDVFGWYQAKNRAAAYGADNNGNGSDQDEAKELVREAIDFVAAEPGVDLSIYDRMDPKDIDGDGNTYEPDGEIDVLVVIHAGRGEEWGGGVLGDKAIWPFRCGFSWYANEPKHEVTYNGNQTILADDFLVFEQDFPMALACHEYGHYLGLPDLYNSDGTSPVQEWSNMGGSYTGSIPGALPPGFGAYCRDELAKLQGGEWAKTMNIPFDSITDQGQDVMISAASEVTPEFNDTIRIDLPKKETIVVTPPEGSSAYFSGSGNDLKNEMTTTLDLGSASTAELQFKTWYDIDPEWDYASVQVRPVGQQDWTPVQGNITTATNPNDDTPNDSTDRNPGHGITNDTAGAWVDASFNLDAFAGQQVELKFYLWTDGNTPEFGMYVDQIRVLADGAVILEDNAEATSSFTMNGFTKTTGKIYADQYYLLEWRNKEGIDVALTHTYYRHPESAFNQGLLVWYVDETYGGDNKLDQDSKTHPGHVSVGVVDAGQNPTIWRNEGTTEANVDKVSYQMHDAAFSLREDPGYRLDWGTVETIDVDTIMQPVFADAYDFTSTDKPEGGLILPEFGLQFYVLEETGNSNAAKIHIKKATGQVSGNAFATELAFAGVEVAEAQLTVKVDGAGLGSTAKAVYVETSNPVKQKLAVELTNGQTSFAGTLPVSEMANGTWEMAYIVFEKADGSLSALYNSAVYNGYGVDLTATAVEENVPPTAVITASATAKVNEAASFAANGSTDVDGTIVSYQWNFGDGATSTEMNPQHTFAAEGQFTVTLTVTDDKGATNVATKVVTAEGIKVITDTEPNNRYNKADGPITSDTLIDGYIDRRESKDIFYFTITDPKTINISMTTDGDAELNWIVYAEDTTTMLSWANNNNGVLEGTFTPQSAGKYYLTVYKSSGVYSYYDVNIDFAN